MAGPVNPFAGLGQKDGPAGSAGRGRGGSSNRPFQPRNTNPPRDTRPRGRGRGASSTTRAGRGQGRGASSASNTWRNKSASQPGPAGSTTSPFAQTKQMAPTPSPFASQVSQQSSPFAGFGKASPSPFGAPSLNGPGGAPSSTGFHRESSPKPSAGATGSNIPVEDVSLLSSYTERYEQVSCDLNTREWIPRGGQVNRCS